MAILVTGAAGFIGYHLSHALLAAGERVIGVDNLNDYYSVALKEARLARLATHKAFTPLKLDIADRAALLRALPDPGTISAVAHLAAQAGVRYSLINPDAYVHANVVGQLAMLELCRKLEGVRHFVYASTSSVYGGNTTLPFSETDRVDDPLSLYAATKRSAELMTHVYARVHGIPTTGLRFFTVYGPWGRPDMSAYLFTDAIFAGKPIQLYNNGAMRRDFTFIDDIVNGVLKVMAGPPPADKSGVRERLYNIGNNRPEELLHYVAVLERAIGKKAIIELAPMQPGEVTETYADISAIQRDFGFTPKTRIEEGIPRFVAWFKAYHGL
ncbi:MAG: NAD-dependent epimerase/dehydratase family protein [Alphaproteobacteria bacterium]|nr:NAD-dependent epimerase/dehydratase family protein [Alphaproteobacteria bacterium]